MIFLMILYNFINFFHYVNYMVHINSDLRGWFPAVKWFQILSTQVEFRIFIIIVSLLEFHRIAISPHATYKFQIYGSVMFICINVVHLKIIPTVVNSLSRFLWNAVCLLNL